MEDFYMKISTEIVSSSAKIGEEKAVEYVAKAGFDAWDFSMFRMWKYDWANRKAYPGEHILAGNDYLKFARKLKQIGLDNGIVCNQSHAPFPSDCDEIYYYAKRAIECTAEAGGKICVIHPCNNKTAAERKTVMKNLSRILLIAFSIMLIVIHAVSPAAALNNTTDNLEAASFTPQERNSYDSIYTLLRIPGYDYPVLAFQSGESETTFRLYGTIEKKTGYYPAEVAIADAGTENERYIISIPDPEPVKNDKKLLAKLSSASYETLPEGFTAIGKTGCVVKMTNIFGTDETYIYGTYGNPDNPDTVYGWYKSKNTSSVPGSLMISLSDASLRMKPDDVRKFSLPRELKNGFSQKVTIWCSNGFKSEVSTFYPEIDYEALQAEVRHQQETKSGVFTEYTIESIPFETKVKENRDRYAAEGDIILQDGVPGEERITWKVTYSDGQETACKKAGSKTVRKPVTRIVERGTRKQEETYIFSDNVKVYAGADSSSVTEGSAITANGVIKVSGSAPKGGYSCKLSIVNETGETVASSARDFPASVSYANAPAGTYTVHASAISADDGSVVNSTFRIVVSKPSGSSEEKEASAPVFPACNAAGCYSPRR